MNRHIRSTAVSGPAHRIRALGRGGAARCASDRLRAGRQADAAVVSAAPGPESLKFAVVGDAGNGSQPQYEVGRQMWTSWAAFPFEFVVAVGDNMYGRQEPQDFVTKFEKPVPAAARRRASRFFGVARQPRQTGEPLLPGLQHGRRALLHVRAPARAIRRARHQPDGSETAGLGGADAATRAGSRGRSCVFHHPLYSDGGRHGSNVELRVLLEPLLVRYGVSVVFAGHEHIYERTAPQKGITYFVAGSGGQLRKGDLHRSAMTAAGFDQDRTFMLVEIAGDEMSFRTISPHRRHRRFRRHRAGGHQPRSEQERVMTTPRRPHRSQPSHRAADTAGALFRIHRRPLPPAADSAASSRSSGRTRRPRAISR